VRCAAEHRAEVQPVLQVAQLAPSMSTTVMSLASDTRLSATVEPTWPAPRITIFTTGTGAKKDAFYAELVFPAPLARGPI